MVCNTIDDWMWATQYESRRSSETAVGLRLVVGLTRLHKPVIPAGIRVLPTVPTSLAAVLRVVEHRQLLRGHGRIYTIRCIGVDQHVMSLVNGCIIETDGGATYAWMNSNTGEWLCNRDGRRCDLCTYEQRPPAISGRPRQRLGPGHTRCDRTCQAVRQRLAPLRLGRQLETRR